MRYSKYTRAKQLIKYLVSDGRYDFIEVRSANYRSHASLDKFRAKFYPKLGTSYILCTKDLMIEDGIVHLPIYMTMFLKKIGVNISNKNRGSNGGRQMKHILTITDKEITGSEKLSAAEPRIAVNAILFDADENIALSYMGKHDLHTLPGGGLEVGEDLYTAIRREIWEETGCHCEIIGELGKIIENRYEHDFTQERSYYIARVTGKKGELHLTDKEIEQNTSVVWLPIEQALRIISEKEHDNYQRKFIKKRDIAALTEALLWIQRSSRICGYMEWEVAE